MYTLMLGDNKSINNEKKTLDNPTNTFKEMFFNSCFQDFLQTATL